MNQAQVPCINDSRLAPRWPWLSLTFDASLIVTAAKGGRA